jgi:hypothetical protein
VVYWFASDLIFNASTQRVEVSYNGPDLDCIATLASEWASLGLDVAHMVSIGGWDAPHVETATPPEELYAAWRRWNMEVVARPGLEEGFAGIDIDLEGNDDVSSPYNFFTVAVLDAVGVLCQLAKADGLTVSLVPPESYLDPTTSAFDQSLLHAYPDNWQPQFKYHGNNAYAYLVSRYGEARARDGASVSTFDVILVQLYETYSHLTYNLTQLGQRAEDYLAAWVPRIVEGWVVDFAADANVSWPTQSVRVHPSQLLIGFGNGWAGGADHRNALVLPDEIGRAHAELARQGIPPRGYFFW